MQSQVNLTHILAALQCASSEETRYYLNGVCVEMYARHTLAIATDGHVLLATHEGVDKDVEDNTYLGSVILSSADLKKIKTKVGPLATMSPVDAKTVKIEQPGAVYYVAVVEGCFPDWRQIVPHADAPHDVSAKHLDKVGYDPRKLVAFVKVADILAGGRRKSAGTGYSMARGDSGPAFIRFPDQDVLGLCMPFRAEPIRTARPVWTERDYGAALAAAAE